MVFTQKNIENADLLSYSIIILYNDQDQTASSLTKALNYGKNHFK